MLSLSNEFRRTTSGCLPAADRHVMFWICSVGDPAANEKNEAVVHCGYHKVAAVTHGY